MPNWCVASSAHRRAALRAGYGVRCSKLQCAACLCTLHDSCGGRALLCCWALLCCVGSITSASCPCPRCSCVSRWHHCVPAPTCTWLAGLPPPTMSSSRAAPQGRLWAWAHACFWEPCQASTLSQRWQPALPTACATCKQATCCWCVASGPRCRRRGAPAAPLLHVFMIDMCCGACGFVTVVPCASE